jgi:hypothetical protein
MHGSQQNPCCRSLQVPDDATARRVSSVHPAPLASMVATNAHAGRLTIKVKLHLTSRRWGSTNHGSAHKIRHQTPPARRQRPTGGVILRLLKSGPLFFAGLGSRPGTPPSEKNSRRDASTRREDCSRFTIVWKKGIKRSRSQTFSARIRAFLSSSIPRILDRGYCPVPRRVSMGSSREARRAGT